MVLPRHRLHTQRRSTPAIPESLTHRETHTRSHVDSTAIEVALAAPLQATRIVTEQLAEPSAGELVLEVERFGLSGNNVSYAKLGNQFGLGYWRPLPAEDGWGRVPAWRVARVVAGDPALADIGERFVGLVPMAQRMRLHAVRTGSGLMETSASREGMLPLYRQMRRVGTDPTWREEYLDVNIVLRPAYPPPTALLDDELKVDGTPAIVLTSATSKTALMIARLLTQRGLRTTGLTSPRHVEAPGGDTRRPRPAGEAAAPQHRHRRHTSRGVRGRRGRPGTAHTRTGALQHRGTGAGADEKTRRAGGDPPGGRGPRRLGAVGRGVAGRTHRHRCLRCRAGMAPVGRRTHRDFTAIGFSRITVGLT